MSGVAIGVSPFLIFGTLLVGYLTQPVMVDRRPTPPRAQPQNLKQHVQMLSETLPARSYPRIRDLDKSADYIKQEFARSTGRISEQSYQVEGGAVRNIMVTFGPEAGERLIVGAHYDTYGGLPGADDNASGVAGLIELSRLMSDQKPAVQVQLVAYALEEPPFFRTEEMGSMQHASSLAKEQVRVRAMLCLEMIGFYTDAKGSQEYPVPGLSAVYPDRGDFIAVVGRTGQIGLVRKVKAAMQAANDLPVWSINAPVNLPGIDFSDHLSYWAKGYDAVMITDTAFYRNRNYHRASDKPQTLDYQRMAKAVDQVFAAVMKLAA